MVHIIGIDLRPLWSGLHISGSEEITDCSNVKVIQLLAAARSIAKRRMMANVIDLRSRFIN